MSRRRLLVLAALVAPALAALGACGSFEATGEPSLTADAANESAPPDDDEGGSPDAATTDAATTCAISEVSDAAPSRDCLGNGQLVQLETSALHCGRCGHSCQGTACSSGLCAPSQRHASGMPFVGSVANGQVYYTSGPDVQRVSADGTVDVVARTAFAGFSVQSFVRDGNRLFTAVTNNNNVVELGTVADVTSGDAGIAPLLSTTALGGLVADEANLYFVQYATVLLVPRTGAGQASIVQQNPQQDSIAGIAAEGREVYWTVIQAANDAGTQNQLLYVRLKDGTVVQRSERLGAPAGLAVDDTHVYWADTSTNSIMRVPRTGVSLPTVVAKWPGTKRAVKALVVQGQRVYWTVSEDLQAGAAVTIYEAPTCAAGGSVLVTAVPGGELYSGLVADGTFLYYGGLGGVWRIAR